MDVLGVNGVIPHSCTYCGVVVGHWHCHNLGAKTGAVASAIKQN